MNRQIQSRARGKATATGTAVSYAPTPCQRKASSLDLFSTLVNANARFVAIQHEDVRRFLARLVHAFHTELRVCLIRQIRR